jgi:hypothetical protein
VVRASFLRLSNRLAADQIPLVLPHPVPSSALPPYALATPTFPFRHLAGLASRAPIGGAREVALACFVLARLAADRLQGSGGLTESGRGQRSIGARGWLGTLALPAAVRAPLARALELCGEGDGAGLSAAVIELAEAAGPFLDVGGKGELEGLGTALRT